MIRFFTIDDVSAPASIGFEAQLPTGDGCTAAFIDNGHIAVTPQGGNLLIMTVDPAELVKTVRASLIRTFTATECSTYGIDPCPTLAEMRAP